MTILESQLLERLRTLSNEKQQEVLDFIEFLIAKAASQQAVSTTHQLGSESFAQTAQPYIGMGEGPENLSTVSPFTSAQQLRDSVHVEGEALSTTVVNQRNEERY